MWWKHEWTGQTKIMLWLSLRSSNDNLNTAMLQYTIVLLQQDSDETIAMRCCATSHSSNTVMSVSLYPLEDNNCWQCMLHGAQPALRHGELFSSTDDSAAVKCDNDALVSDLPHHYMDSPRAKTRHTPFFTNTVINWALFTAQRPPAARVCCKAHSDPSHTTNSSAR